MVIGNKKTFAIEVDNLRCAGDAPWGNSAVWLSGTRLGNFLSGDYLYSFLRAISRIVFDKNDFYDIELVGLDCADFVYSIDPFFDDPDKFYDADDAVIDELVKYDKYQLFSIPNYDAVFITVFVVDEDCKFIWLPSYDQKIDNSFRKMFQCTHVPHRQITELYAELCTLMPIECWPHKIRKVNKI